MRSEIEDKIEVSKTGLSSIWIGIRSDLLISQTSNARKKVMALQLGRTDAAWLIGAIRKELYGVPGDDVERWMTEQDPAGDT